MGPRPPSLTGVGSHCVGPCHQGLQDAHQDRRRVSPHECPSAWGLGQLAAAPGPAQGAVGSGTAPQLPCTCCWLELRLPLAAPLSAAALLCHQRCACAGWRTATCAPAVCHLAQPATAWPGRADVAVCAGAAREPFLYASQATITGRTAGDPARPAGLVGGTPLPGRPAVSCSHTHCQLWTPGSLPACWLIGWAARVTGSVGALAAWSRSADTSSDCVLLAPTCTGVICGDAVAACQSRH